MGGSARLRSKDGRFCGTSARASPLGGQHLTGKGIYINIHEIKRPEVDAQLVGDNIARQLERRIAFRRCMKKAVSSAMRL